MGSSRKEVDEGAEDAEEEGLGPVPGGGGRVAGVGSSKKSWSAKITWRSVTDGVQSAFDRTGGTASPVSGLTRGWGKRGGRK
jgi:hypothetical protein